MGDNVVISKRDTGRGYVDVIHSLDHLSQRLSKVRAVTTWITTALPYTCMGTTHSPSNQNELVGGCAIPPSAVQVCASTNCYLIYHEYIVVARWG